MSGLEITDAYAAGVFDGEGSVGIYSVTNGSGLKRYPTVKLAVVGTHKPMMEALWRHFGVGLFTTQKRQAMSRTPRGEEYYGKQGWKWMLTSRADVEMVLVRITPHLIEKREQAEIVLSFCREEIPWEEAAKACKEAKKFSYPLEDFPEYAPRRNAGNLAGENNPAATITEPQVIEIKRRLSKGERGTDIARSFGVSKSVVSRINTGRTWAHITVPPEAHI